MNKNPFSKLMRTKEGGETKFAIFLHKAAGFCKKQYKKESTKSILSSIISIVIGLLIGLIVMIIVSLLNKDISIASAFKGFGIVISGPFASSNIKYVIKNGAIK